MATEVGSTPHRGYLKVPPLFALGMDIVEWRRQMEVYLASVPKEYIGQYVIMHLDESVQSVLFESGLPVGASTDSVWAKLHSIFRTIKGLPCEVDRLNFGSQCSLSPFTASPTDGPSSREPFGQKPRQPVLPLSKNCVHLADERHSFLHLECVSPLPDELEDPMLLLPKLVPSSYLVPVQEQVCVMIHSSSFLVSPQATASYSLVPCACTQKAFSTIVSPDTVNQVGATLAYVDRTPSNSASVEAMQSHHVNDVDTFDRQGIYLASLLSISLVPCVLFVVHFSANQSCIIWNSAITNRSHFGPLLKKSNNRICPLILHGPGPPRASWTMLIRWGG